MARTFKVMLVALVVLVLAGSAYAFAAANTVAQPGGAGYKASVIGGYTVTNVVYDLNDTTPTKLAKITFDIAPTSPNTAEAVTVKISTAASQSFSACTVSGTTTITATCITTVDVAAVVALDIVASSSDNPIDG
jgi:hypothetical protein